MLPLLGCPKYTRQTFTEAFFSPFQTFVVLQLIALLAPLIEGFPVGLIKPHLFLNELAINYGENSYIELYAHEEMPEDQFKDLYYGLLLVKPSSTKRNTVVTGVIDLPRLRAPKPGLKYFVYGTPKPEFIKETDHEYMNTPYGPDPDHAKFFTTKDKWLSVDEKEVLMVILTRSKTESILSALELKETSKKVFLQDQSKLVKYIDESMVDSVILRGPKGCRRSRLVEDYLPQEIVTSGRMQPFIMVTKAVFETTNKCDAGDIPFNHDSYKEGPATPGQPNSCDGNKINIENELDKFTKRQPSTVENLDESCNIGGEDEDDFSMISPEQLNAEKEKTELESARSSGHEVCRPRDQMDYDSAELLNNIQRLQNKRKKIVKPWSDLCPGEEENPLIRQRIRHNLEATKFIAASVELAEKLDVTLIKGKQWFNLLRDYRNPLNSKFNCFYCSQFSTEFRLRNQLRLANKDGIMDTKSINSRLIREHESRSTHRDIMDKYRKKYLRELPDAIQGDIMRSERPEFHITNKHIR